MIEKARKTRKLKFLPWLFLLSIWFLFFWKFFLRKLLPLPLDIITGVYFPWLSHKWGTTTGVPVKNPILSDAISQFWIWRNWAIDSLKIGKIAIWNPYALLGYPLSPWFHTILFSPANLFYLFWERLSAMSLIVSCQLLAALFSMFLLLEDLLDDFIPAIFGSISFSFSAFLIGWLTWGTVGWTIAILPLIIFFANKLIDSRYRPIYFIGFCFSIIFSLLGGHPQTFLYVFLALMIYLAGRLFFKDLNNKGSRLRIILAGSLLSLLAGSFVLLPSIEILSNSIRSSEGYLQNVNFGFLPLLKIIILMFAPNFFGNPASGNYWGGGFNFQEHLVWFGSAALVLVFMAIIGRSLIDKSKVKKFQIFLVIFILGILFSLKYPLGFLVYKLNLPFLSKASAARALVLTSFAGSVLASFGLEILLSGKPKRKVVAWTIFLWFLVVLAAGIYLISILLASRFSIFRDLFKATLDMSAVFKVASRNLVLPIISSGLVIIAILASVAKPPLLKTVRRITGLFLILVALGEGFYFGWKYIPFVDRSFYFPKTPVIDFLETKYLSGVPFRIEIEKGEILPPNMWMSYRFYSSGGYDPVYPARYADFLKKVGLNLNYSRYVEWQKDNPVFDDLGVKYFLVLKRDLENKVSTEGTMPASINIDHWFPVFEENPIVVLENKFFSPPYSLFDLKGEQSFQGGVELIKKSDDFWQFAVSSREQAILVLKENFSPGWQVLVNGRKREIEVFQDLFKAVTVTPDDHQVIFYYQNNWFWFGLLVSWLSLSLIFIASFIFVRFKEGD